MYADQNMLHVAAYEGHLEMVTFLLTKYKIEDLSLRDKVHPPHDGLAIPTVKTTLLTQP
jgi:hypothetical protein